MLAATRMKALRARIVITVGHGAARNTRRERHTTALTVAYLIYHGRLVVTTTVHGLHAGSHDPLMGGSSLRGRSMVLDLIADREVRRMLDRV